MLLMLLMLLMLSMSSIQRASTSQPQRYGTVTTAICVVFGVVYLVECYVGGGALWDISPQVLIGLGGNLSILSLGQGQYWRLFVSALLHGGLLHVAFNTYAMLIIGSAIEKKLNAGWTVGAFVFSGMIGSLLSAYASRANVVAIGASGGIVGLVAMAAALSYLAPRLVWFSRNVLVQWLVFSVVIGLVPGVDFWGHIGGIAGGALCALVAAACKRQPEVVRKIGLVVGAVGLIVAAGSVLLAVQSVLALLSN